MYTYFVVTYAISSIIALGLLYLSIYKGNEERTTYFSFFVFNIFLYCIGVLIEITSKDTTQANIANTIACVGVSFTAPVFLLLVCEYIDRQIKNKWLVCSLFIIPVLGAIFVATYPLNGLFYTEYKLVTNFGLHYINAKGSIYMIIMFGYMFILYAVTFGISIYGYIVSEDSIKKNVSFLAKGIIAPLIAGGAYLLEITPFKIDFTPVVLIFVCAYYAHNIINKKAFLAIPFARTNVLDDMNSGYFLVDSNNNYLDSNKVAKDIFPIFKTIKMGTSLNNIGGILEELMLISDEVTFKEANIELEDGEKRHYSFSKSIVSQSSTISLKSWVIHDITVEKNMMINLEFMANHDSLTKIFNRKAFFTKAIDSFYKNIKAGKPFAIFIIDIDFFKQINDQFGHPHGDQALIKVVERVKSNLRKNDVFARYGGEEFVLLIDKVTPEAALKIGESLRESVEKEVFKIGEHENKITISIGISMYNKEKHKNVDDILASADDLLYKAKRTGRNKVVIE